MKKSMPWFKRIIVRRTTYGTGKITLGGFNQWFRLNAEQGYEQIKSDLENTIKNELFLELDQYFDDVQND